MRRYKQEDTCIPKIPAACVEYPDFVSEHTTLTEEEKDCPSARLAIKDLYKLIDEIKAELPEEGTLDEKLDELASKIQTIEEQISTDGVNNLDITTWDLDTSCMPEDPCGSNYTDLRSVLQQIITTIYCPAS